MNANTARAFKLCFIRLVCLLIPSAVETGVKDLVQIHFKFGMSNSNFGTVEAVRGHSDIDGVLIHAIKRFGAK